MPHIRKPQAKFTSADKTELWSFASSLRVEFPLENSNGMVLRVWRKARAKFTSAEKTDLLRAVNIKSQPWNMQRKFCTFARKEDIDCSRELQPNWHRACRRHRLKRASKHLSLNSLPTESVGRRLQTQMFWTRFRLEFYYAKLHGSDYLHACVPTFTNTYILTYMPTCMQASMRRYF